MSHSNTNQNKCPCGTNIVYSQCCEPYHKAAVFASTPEKLMRSRYSAYVLLLEAYLLKTWHASTRPISLELSHEAVTHPKKWLGLNVLHCQQASPISGMVEFVARYKVNGKAYKMHEISNFVLENNQWFYVDGQFLN